MARKPVCPAAPDRPCWSVPNSQAGEGYVVRFTQPEFASLCPITGQPDFAHLVIDYVPGDWLVESKSLKLYLGSFSDHSAFHEDCTVGIGKRLAEAIAPQWLRIGGYWYRRGGLSRQRLTGRDKETQGVSPPADGGAGAGRAFEARRFWGRRHRAAKAMAFANRP